MGGLRQPTGTPGVRATLLICIGTTVPGILNPTLRSSFGDEPHHFVLQPEDRQFR